MGIGDFICSREKGLAERFMDMSFLYYYYESTQASRVMHEEEVDRCGRR